MPEHTYDNGTTRWKFIEAAVDRHFRPPNAGLAVRRQVFAFVGTVLVVLSALAATDWLAWLLWAWVAYRTAILGMLLALGPRIADAMTRRLGALPPIWRDHLDGTASVVQEVRR